MPVTMGTGSRDPDPGSRRCSVCGAPVRAGRNWCGRCGGDPTGASGSKGGRSTARVAVIGASVVLVMGMAAMAMRTGSGQPDGTSASASATPPTAEPSVTTRPGATTPASQFASIDASRGGTAAYAGGDMASALAQYTAAVDANPNNAEGLNNLGQILVRMGRPREAIAHFDRAIALEAGVWAYHFNRARAYGELKEWRQAAIGYTEASRLFPDDYVTHFNLARAKQADGDLRGAIDAYARAIELAPGQADFHLWYGQALDQSGRPSDAAAEYQKFLELEPEASQAEKVKARLAQLGQTVAGSSAP